MILGADGNFYGITELGGGDCVNGCGTVFKMTPAGALTTLHEFTGSPAQGYLPFGLVEATTGVLLDDTNQGGPGGIGTAYSVGDGLAPFVKLVTNYGPVGKTIDILGQGFTGATGVTFDGVKAVRQRVGYLHDGGRSQRALTGAVTVTTFTDTYKSNNIFKVTPPFTSFSPAGGIVGSTVTLNGVSLTQASSVTIGGLAATFKVVSDKELTAVVPAGAKNAQSIVITTLGGSANKGLFAVEPHVTSFTPTSGPVGTDVTISGTTFTKTSKVTFGGIDATSFEVINDSEIKAVVPSGATTGPIAITTPSGTATSTATFTVN